jgi:ribosome-interacting GTPase 1
LGQVLDLPGIIEGAKDGKGRGRQVISAARTCNMILIVLDCMKPVTHKRLIERELAGFGIRLNQTPPDIVFRKKDKGGVNYQEAVPQTKGLNRDQCTRILKEFRITSADIVMRGDYDADEFIDIINGDCKVRISKGTLELDERENESVANAKATETCTRLLPCL